MRPNTRALTLGLFLVTALPATAHAQGISDEERDLIRLFGEADTAYSNGDCATHLARLDAASRRLDEARERSAISAVMSIEYMQRESQSRLRPCPRDTTPPPPAPTGTQPGWVAGPTGGREEYDRQLEAMLEQYARRMLRARRATAARDCAERNAALDEAFAVARDGLLRLRGSTDGIGAYIQEIRAERAKPCGPAATTDRLPPEEQHIQDQQALYRQRQDIEAQERRTRELMDVQRMQREQDEANRRAARSLLQIAPVYGEWEIPPANYGFQRDGAGTEERPAAFSKDIVPMFGFDVGAEFGGLGIFDQDSWRSNNRIFVSLGVRWGDASNSTQIPVSTTGGARGYPYTDESPSGSTGIGGNVALDVDTEVSLNQFAPRLGYAWDVGGKGETVVRGSYGHFFDPVYDNLTLFVAADGLIGDRDHRGVVSITTPVIATQTLEQDVNELEIGVTVGARKSVSLGTGAHVTFGGELGLYLFDFDLTSVETNDQNFGPTLDRSFTTRVEDSKSGVGYRGGAFAELSINLGRSVQMFVGGQAMYSSHRAQIINPFSGNFLLAGGTTFLATEDAFDWRVSAGLRLRWGTR